ncbi:MAG: hypothetical protein FWC62_05670 [Firmicutes bacterium]|nr:hypothetical protein [Bacillota bacterium]
MLDNTFIKQLKQTNISADGEKTGARVRQIWKSANGANRDEVMALADVALSTVQRTYKTGSLSAKLAVALAQVLKINPFYLTAETDEDEGVFNEDILREFLIAHGYEAIAPVPKARRRRTKVEPVETDVKNDTEAEPVAVPEIMIELIECEEEPAAPTHPVELSDDDVLMLLRALRLKAACGVEGAVDALAKLYGILLE